VGWEDAAFAAELAGKRLMEEAEYEYAATNGGTTTYPWGNAPRTGDEPWQFGPAGGDPWDETRGEAIVRGLCSNVAEWTATQFTLYPALHSLPLSPEAREMYIVRGGTKDVIARNVRPGQWDELPHLRLETKYYTWEPGLGFRCARSAHARLQAADFGKVVEK
jgi:formylglycine-generating enzyme required for sulfatase activity